MNYHVNLAIQVLPLGIPKPVAYFIIDKAINCIKESGLKYEVCPFETVIEGSYEAVMQLVDEVQLVCKNAGAEELLLNMKLQRSFKNSIAIEDKMEQYRD